MLVLKIRSFFVCAILLVAIQQHTALAAVLPSSRIVGGDEAVVGQFPYQISLQREDGSHTCGATILNERFSLTAAHCVVAGRGIAPYPPQYFQGRIGSIQRTAGGELVKFKRITVHQGYGNFLNDVALLEFEKPLTFTANIQPIELADSEVPSGDDVIVSGWGRIYNNGPIPHRLKYNTLKALNTQECDEAINFGYDSVLCLAHTVDNGVCNGDSGGPATYKGKLVGAAGFVVSGCGTTNPDGYAKVFYHREWILQNMGL